MGCAGWLHKLPEKLQYRSCRGCWFYNLPLDRVQRQTWSFRILHSKWRDRRLRYRQRFIHRTIQWFPQPTGCWSRQSKWFIRRWMVTNRFTLQEDHSCSGRDKDLRFRTWLCWESGRGKMGWTCWGWCHQPQTCRWTSLPFWYRRKSRRSTRQIKRLL